MLVSDDELFIKETALYLQKTNETRKQMTKTQCEEAEQLLEEQGLKNVIILHGETFHEGIIGLIAGRLKEKYNRPVIVFTHAWRAFKGVCSKHRQVSP